MVRSSVLTKVRRFIWWILCLSFLSYVIITKRIITEDDEVVSKNGNIEKIERNLSKKLGEVRFREAVDKSVGLEVVESFPDFSPFKCVSTAKLHRDLSSVICVKDPKVDKFVSGGIIKTGCWEKHIVVDAMRSVDNYPSAVFLDIGANIGMYTVMVAKMKRRVVAVDPIRDNLALISSSVHQAGSQEYVQFVASPISDLEESLVPVTDNRDNQGGTRLVPANMLTPDHQVSGPAVNTTTLRQLVLFANINNVIIKLDVEGFECRVLGPYLAQPVRDVFLPYIFLEWMHAGYQPYDLVSKRKLQPDKSKMAKHDDLLWVHNSATPLF